MSYNRRVIRRTRAQVAASDEILNRNRNLGQYKGQPKWFVRAQCNFWLCNGLTHNGPLNSKPVAGLRVYADTAKEAHELVEATGDYEWAKVYEDQEYTKPAYPVVVDPTTLPKDHPDYCPF